MTLLPEVVIQRVQTLTKGGNEDTGRDPRDLVEVDPYQSAGYRPVVCLSILSTQPQASPP